MSTPNAKLKNTITPGTPAAGYTRVYVDSADKHTKQIDDAGVIIDLASVAVLDGKAKVSSNDTTSGFLNGKLIAGSGISLTENNDGANETLTIASTGGSAADSDQTILAGQVFC